MIKCLAAALCLACVFPSHPAGCISQVSGTGRASAVFGLSAYPITGQAANTVTTQLQGVGVHFTAVVDFGDLAAGSGEPMVAVVGLRVKGNAPYSLNISQLSYWAADLQIGDRDVSGTEDGGSFIVTRAGSLAAQGARADVAGSRVSPQLVAGITLDKISRGQVQAHSTAVVSGGAPSLGGTLTTEDNGVDVPIYFSVPSGLAVGPTPGAAKGQFEVNVQVGVFVGE